MKRTYYVLLLIFSSMLFSLHAQINTEGAFGGTGEDSIVSVSPTVAKDGYVVYGISNSFSSSSEIFLMRADQAGNYAWATNISNTNWGFQPIAACEANGSTPQNENYVVILHRNNEDYLHILNYNRNSDSFTAKNYLNIQINNMGCYGIQRTPNGYILIVYQIGGSRTQVISFDNNFQNFNRLSEQHSSSVTTDVLVDNNRIFLAGTATDNRYIFLKEVSENLSSTGIGEKFYNVQFDQGGEARATHVQVARNASGEFVIATNAASNPTNGKVIINTDANGDNAVAYEYGIENTADFYITDVAAVSDGYVFTGYTSASYSNSAGLQDMLFVKLDASMNLVKAAIFGDADYDSGKFIFGNSDNSITLYGTTSSFSSAGDNDFYVIKTGTSGNALCNERTVGFALEKETLIIPGGASIYDNSVSISNQGDPGITYVTTDVTMTSLCGCTQEITFETSGSACEGEPVMFNDLGGNLNYIWDFGGAFIDSTTVDGTIYITYGSPGIRIVSVSVANNSCFQASSKPVVIYPVPDITITAPASVCTGTYADFTSSVTPVNGGPWQYNWDLGESANPALSTAQNVYGVTYTGFSKQATVSLTVFDEHCSSIETVQVQVVESPNADFEALSPVCTGNQVSFINKSTDNVSYSWTFDLANVAEGTSTQKDATHIYNTSGEKVVQLIASSGACKDTSEQSVIIHQTPTVSFVSTPSVENPYCTGSLVDFNATVSPTTGYQWNYEWSFGKGNNAQYATVEDPRGILFNEAGSIVVSLIVNDEYCSATTTNTLTIGKTPVADFYSSEPACTGETVEFIFTGSNANSYEWFSGEGDFSVAQNPSFVYDSEGEKNVQLIVENGQCRDTVNNAVTIHATPVINFSSDVAANNCAGDNVSFVSVVSPGQAGVDWTYTWDFGAGAKQSSSTSENPANIVYLYGGTKEVSLQVQSDYCSKFFTQTIHVDSLPIPFVVEDDTVCADRCINIGANAIAGYQYLWSPASTLSNNKISNPVACPIAAYTTYRLTVTDLNGCSATDSVTITMLQAAVANAGIDGIICRNESFQIGAAFVEGQSYSWQPTKGLDNPLSSSPVATPDSTTIYTVSVQYKGCEVITDQVEIIVHQLPLVRAYIENHLDSLTIAKGESAQLYAVGATQFEWIPVESLNNEGIYNPVAQPDSTTIYFVEGTDVYGCKNIDSVVIIVVEPSFWVPNAFSPNGDNLNDYFYVRTKETTEFKLSIFSRNGQILFTTDNKLQGWDGKNATNGEDVPQGAYVYYVKGTLSDGEDFNQQGIINLIR